MKIRCIANNGKNLLENTLNAGYSKDILFKELKFNQEYVVYSISLELNIVFYLILTNENQPMWYPAELFEITNNLLPMICFFNFFGYEKTPSAIWGYKEMALDQDHYTDLVEGKEGALKIFFDRKGEIDEYDQLCNSTKTISFKVL